MLLKLDKGLWTEIPDNATEEFKAAKIAKYNKEKENKEHKFINVLQTEFLKESHNKQREIGSLYDKRNKRGAISHSKYTQTIIKNNGIKRDANEKVQKTIIQYKY